ncbi:MAG: hypothetical protein RJB32_136, partial [Actinomycetota bacterium]
NRDLSAVGYENFLKHLTSLKRWGASANPTDKKVAYPSASSQC